MEKLYNNIITGDDFFSSRCDFNDTPYLKSPPEIIDVSVGRQLFVDDFLIEKTDLTPEYHTAKKFEGNPILFPEAPWEKEESPVACPKSGGVFYDEEEKIFKMWYEASWLKHMCYATSKDGIHWERPSLDVCEGTNKILTYDGYESLKLYGDIKYLRPDSTTVFIDYSCPKSEKYKFFLRNPGWIGYGIVAVSGDGIHFDRFKKTSDLYDRSTIFYNPFRKKWVYSIRNMIEVNGWYDRTRDYRECDDFLTGAEWTPEERHDWMRTDELDRPNPYINYFKPQLYNVDCVGYESIILGMFQIMYGPENDVCEKGGVPKVTELIPMYSRDGFHFTRPCRNSIVNASLYRGSWDRGYVQSVGGIAVINGDELWIYYIGFGGDENYAEGHDWMSNGMYKNGATGIAKLRRDGFVSMNGDGKLLTRKLQFSGKTDMFINASGTVSAKIIDENGKLIATSSIFDGDSTKAKLVFDLLNVSDLNGKVFRIEFTVKGKLYSFGFADENGDFGGAHAAGMVK